jgi:hypothetical protein
VKAARLVSGFRAGFFIGCIIGFVFLALGAYSIYYFLAVKQVMEHSSNSLFANYGVDGVFLIILGLSILSKFYPILIPLKKIQTQRTCPFCGAIVEEDEVFCKKCNQQLPSETDTVQEENE